MRRVHAVTDGTPEFVDADLAAMPGRVRRSLGHQLAEGERIVIRTTQHPVSLGRTALWPVLALVVYLWLDLDVHAAPRMLGFALFVLVLTLLRLAWAEAQRRFRWIVVTNKRILIHEGILDIAVPMMRLTKVTDMTYRRSLLGGAAGFGTIIIESAGQQQAIRELTYLPDPDDVNAALNAVIFEEKPRERRERRQRRQRFRRGGRGDRGPGGGPDDGPGGGPGGGRGGNGGPPRGRGPGPRTNPPGAGGGVDVSPAGHPPAPKVQPETWYRSSNLAAPRRLGDTGEIPVVRVGESERWLAERRADERAHAVDLEPEPDPFARWGYTARHGQDGSVDDGHHAQDVREIPLYPPRDWIDPRS